MTIASGTFLGPYEILGLVGTGGMGEVYRARDRRLGRHVAVKVLPPETAADRDRLSRFEREARLASSLNHPNIVTIYDIGKVNSLPYIAMELIEGETVRGLLDSGAIPARRVVSIALQIADALAKAHESGIVHRDLKPENVMVTTDGVVKVLDFGLGKTAPQFTPFADSTVLAAHDPTHPGTVLGTTDYMSPEQASGKEMDFRSDQFALGSIIYEMTSGKRAFRRETAVQTMSAIIAEPPEPLSAYGGTPESLLEIVERCLQKNPKKRYAATRSGDRTTRVVRRPRGQQRRIIKNRHHIERRATTTIATEVGACSRRGRRRHWSGADAVGTACDVPAFAIRRFPSGLEEPGGLALSDRHRQRR